MKAQVRTGKVWIEVEAENMVALFGQVADLLEVFDAEQVCGCCHSARIQPRHRRREKYHFYELVCLECGAFFRFGESTDKRSLFPKRYGDDRRPLKFGGWEKFDASARKGTK